MWDLWGITLLALSISSVQALIVPDEVPSLLSVIYSNIPTIKKGTDSRLGWGFRLGNRADFQVLVELGPQQETQPLGNQDTNSGSSKRQALDSLSNLLYAQRLREKQENKRKKTEIKQRLNSAQQATISDTEGGKWLENWSKNVRQRQKPDDAQQLSLEPRPGIGIGEIDAKSVIPPDEPQQDEVTKLEKFLNAKRTQKINSGDGGTAAAIKPESALDDVSLD